jgi:hypothetical protein
VEPWLLLRYAEIIDAILPLLHNYYAYALHRSQGLFHNALNSQVAQPPIMVLACGRFHLHDILRIASDEHRLSVIVVEPFPKADSEQKDRPTWTSLEEEESLWEDK